SVVAKGTAPTDGGGCFGFDAGVDLAPGMFVSVADGTTTKRLTVVTLTIDAIDPDTDTVSGTAPPNTTFHVDAAQGNSEDFTSADPVTADGAGNWTADFGAVGFDIVPGTHVGADIHDRDGDATALDRNVPNPT